MTWAEAIEATRSGAGTATRPCNARIRIRNGAADWQSATGRWLTSPSQCATRDDFMSTEWAIDEDVP